MKLVKETELGHTWIFLRLLVQPIIPSVKFFNKNKFSGSEYEGIMALDMFQDQAFKMGYIMTCLVEMMSTWFLSILAFDILLVLSKSFLETSGAETHIFTFGEISTV